MRAHERDNNSSPLLRKVKDLVTTHFFDLAIPKSQRIRETLGRGRDGQERERKGELAERLSAWREEKNLKQQLNS